MDTYIVRIYRYGKNELKELVGLVEVPGSDGRIGFTNVEELWGILNADQKGKWRTGKRDWPFLSPMTRE